MQDYEQFEAFLDLCQATYRRLKRDGEWPWPTRSSDSQDPEDMVESEDNPQNP